MPPPVRTYRVSEIREDEALAVGKLLATVWPRPDRGPVERAEKLKRIGREFDGPAEHEPISVIIWKDEAVIAHALTFGRTIGTTSGELDIMALAMVAADPNYRGQGLGAAVAQAALERVDMGSFAYSLFQTTFHVQSFYERLGAKVVENRIYNSLDKTDPEANPFWDDLVMHYPAEPRNDVDWPTGDLDLRGPGY